MSETRPSNMDCTYIAITNIPKDYHAADLRAHFSTFIENGSFFCFHFRHRPEKIKSSVSSNPTSKSKFCCVVVKIRSSRLIKFKNRYHNEQWIDASSNYSTHVCNISIIKLCSGNSDSYSNSAECIEEEKLLKMPEMNPPNLMPNGNVGTPTSVFLDFIQRCLLPDHLISTLKLKFPKTEGKRLYSNVSYHYKELEKNSNKLKRKGTKVPLNCSKPTQKQSVEPDICLIAGKSQNGNDSFDTVALNPSFEDRNSVGKSERNSISSVSFVDRSKLTKKQLKKLERQETLALMNENIEEHLIGIEKKYHNDEDAEEWDRHEAIDDDPSNQERNKERLYEEEIEQPWEKGGPGVVFYTDAMYWQAQEGDFDEQTTDDLDVDFSPYEGDGAGDKDIRDFLKIRQEKRFRSGYDKTDRFSIGLSAKPVTDGRPSAISSLSLPGPSYFKQPCEKIGQFDVHTKGVGRKILEKQGWIDGQGLGKSQSGIKQALKGEGQKPQNKKGLGFVKTEPACHGSSSWKKAKRLKTCIISTAFDNPHETDPKEKLLERQEPTILKHRKCSLDKFPPVSF